MDSASDFNAGRPAYQLEVERISGLSWEAVVGQVKGSILQEIEHEYRRAFLNLIADDECEAIHIIGSSLEKSQSQILHWQNPDRKYGPIGYVTIWQGFAALNQVFLKYALPSGRDVSKKACRNAISSICTKVLKARVWDDAQSIAMLETDQAYWDTARRDPERRERAVKQLLQTVRSFTGKRPNWTFEQIEQWSRIWQTAWRVFRSGDNFSWANDDGRA